MLHRKSLVKALPVRATQDNFREIEWDAAILGLLPLGLHLFGLPSMPQTPTSSTLN